MRNIVRTLVVAVALAAVPGWAHAQGEVFKIETSGTQYCGDFDGSKFNAKNNVDLYLHVVTDGEWDLDFSPLFPSPIPVIGTSYFATQKKLVFSGSQFFDDGSYIAIQGTAMLDRSNRIAKASGTFIQDSLVSAGCFSSGKWMTTTRIQ